MIPVRIDNLTHWLLQIVLTYLEVFELLELLLELLSRRVSEGWRC